MRRKQTIQNLWPSEEKPPRKLEIKTVEEKKEEASFSLDANELAKAIAPSLQQRDCPPCLQHKPSLSTNGFVTSKEGVLIALVAVLAATTLLCALMCVYIAHCSSRAITKLEALLR
jgi:hypothetical protein